MKTILRLTGFGDADTAGASSATGWATAGFSGSSVERRAVVSSESCARIESAMAEASRAGSLSAVFGSVRRIRAAWSLAAAIKASSPITNAKQKRPARAAANYKLKLALTERFGQDILQRRS